MITTQKYTVSVLWLREPAWRELGCIELPARDGIVADEMWAALQRVLGRRIGVGERTSARWERWSEVNDRYVIGVEMWFYRPGRSPRDAVVVVFTQDNDGAGKDRFGEVLVRIEKVLANL